MKVIYLACPYTHRRIFKMGLRAAAANTAAAQLMAKGYAVLSPISHGHAICRAGDLLGLEVGRNYAAWRQVDQALVKAADEVWVLTLPGHEESQGIKAELALAAKLGKPILHVTPEELEALPALEAAA